MTQCNDNEPTSDIEVVVSAAKREASHLRWLGYPESLRKADEIDAAATRVAASPGEQS